MARRIGYTKAQIGEITWKANDVLHNALMRADEAYQTALVKAYGKRAGDIRYQPEKQSPKVRELHDSYVLAVEQWRETWKRTAEVK